jgi:NAD(P)-dependent dehydrogenase (short-subunit alcohol dehydrogenase family)
LLDRDAGRVSEETGRLQAAGLDVQGRVVDVTDHPALDAAFDESAARYGRLDVVFANAGIDSGPGFSAAGLARTVAARPKARSRTTPTNAGIGPSRSTLNAVFATVRAAARHMKPRRSGRIIVTTSVAAVRVEPAVGAAYMAAKAACHHLVHNVAMELAMHNITVNAIAPGLFVTNIGGGHLKNPELQKVFAQAVPMQRVGFPDDIHGLALFLASPPLGTSPASRSRSTAATCSGRQIESPRAPRNAPSRRAPLLILARETQPLVQRARARKCARRYSIWSASTRRPLR